MGDVIVIADDDEVRSNASQNRVTATLCTGKFSSGLSTYSSLLISVSENVGGGEEIDSQHDTWSGSSWVLTSQRTLSVINRVYQTYMSSMQIL